MLRRRPVRRRCWSGLMRQVRARLEGRAGAGIGQPWRDLRKLLRQPAGHPDGHRRGRSGWRRCVLLATVAGRRRGRTVVDHRVAAGPGRRPVRGRRRCSLLGTVALALAGLDTGTAFGGMGASREITILALVEPTILVAVFALSARVGLHQPGRDRRRHPAPAADGSSRRRACSPPPPCWSSSSPRPVGCRWTTRPPTWS